MGFKLLFVTPTLYLAWMTDFAFGYCNAYGGTVGKAECIPPVEGYTAYQWATCLSDSYIQEKSRGRHACEDRLATYCYYQCQLEIYGQEYGSISGKCKCDPFDITPSGGDYHGTGDGGLYNLGQTTMAPTTIASWCKSPDGTECRWYKDCLNKKRPCIASENGYTLDYAEAFCKLNHTSNHQWYGINSRRVTPFSDTGLKWVNAVRKCLLVALVPFMRPWMSPTCKEIKKDALDSQMRCYLSAYPDAPSICDLSCTDWAKFFWTARSKIYSSASYVEAMKSAVDVMSTCGKNASIVGTGCPTQMLRLTLNYEKHIVTGDQHGFNRLAGEATDKLAKRLGWKTERMGWFAYASNITFENSKLMLMHLILANKNGLTQPSRYSNQISDSLTDIVDALFDHLERGLLYDLGGVHGGSTSVLTLETCR